MRKPITLCFIVSALLGAGPSITKASAFDPIKVVSTAQTAYPELSVVMGGTLILQVVVNQTGGIEKIKVIHGIRSLTEQAERSVRQWKFEPATVDGKPEASVLVAAFSFSRPVPLGPTLKLAAMPHEPGERFEPIQVISATQAFYPEGVLTHGTVIFEVAVSSSGAIEAIKTIHGIQRLTEQAKEALKQWKFRPAQLDGTPVASSMIACFTFASSILNSRRR